MAFFILQVFIHVYCMVLITGNVVLYTDSKDVGYGRNVTLLCKLNTFKPAVMIWMDDFPLAEFNNSTCGVNHMYHVNQYTCSCDVSKLTYNLTVNNISKHHLGKVFECRDGENFYNITLNITDIDECRERPDVCLPGRCRNTQGGYRCDCSRGYRPSTDGKQCVETKVDELEESQKHDYTVVIAVVAVVAVKYCIYMFCVKKKGICDRKGDGDNGATADPLNIDNNEDVDTDEKQSIGDVENGLLQNNVGKQNGLKQSSLCDSSTLSSQPGDSTNSHVANSGCEGNLVGENGRDLVHLDQEVYCYVEEAVTSTDEKQNNGDVGNGPLLKTSMEKKGSQPIQNSASISLTQSHRRGYSSKYRVIYTRCVREQKENICEESQSEIDSNSGKVSEPNLEVQGDGNLMNNTVHKYSVDDISTVNKETLKAVSPRMGTSVVKQLDSFEEEDCIPKFKNAQLNLPESAPLQNTRLLNWPVEEQNNKVSDRTKPCSEVLEQKIEPKGSRFQIASCSSQGQDEDYDVNVEDDDSEKCCTFQYSEDDVIPWASDEPDEDREREALIGTFLSTADAPTCSKSHSRLTSTVCNKRVSGTPEELKEYADLCLKRHDGELDAVDVKAEEQFQEYTWAGQTRMHGSSMLDGGYAVCNKRVSGTPEELKEYAELCLKRRDGELDAVDVKAEEQFQEYTWAGQTRKRASSMLDGGYADIEGAYNPEDSVTSSQVKCEPKDDMVCGSAGQIAALRCPPKEKNEQTGPTCFICKEEYNTPMASTQCGHVHCRECWLRTMRARKLCPQCNKITSQADLHIIYL